MIMNFSFPAIANTSSGCVVYDFDQMQGTSLTNRIKKVLKKRGYQITKNKEESNFTASENCFNEANGDYCGLSVINLENNKSSFADHFEGAFFPLSLRFLNKTHDYLQIATCAELLGE